jgi:hypothetical protein
MQLFVCALLAIVAIVLCWISGWAYGRQSYEHRGIGLNVDEDQNLITVTNTGRVIEQHVVVIISAISSVDGKLGAHVERADSDGPTVMHAAERKRIDQGFRDTTFIYTADLLPPNGQMVVRLTTDRQPARISIVASASIANAHYTYPDTGELLGVPTFVEC